MFTGSTGKSSSIKALEDALFAFENLAFGTPPSVRYFIPGSPGRNAVLRVTLDRIIDPMTFKTDPPVQSC